MDIVTILKIKAITLFIIALLNFLLALLIWHRGRSKATLHLGFMALFSGFYACIQGGIFYFWETAPGLQFFFWRASWIGVLMAASCITFVYYFVQRTKYLEIKSFLWYLIGLIITGLALTTPLIIKAPPVFIPRQFSFEGETGILEPLGRLYILFAIIIILVNLLRHYFKTTGLKRLQIKYFILGTTIYGIGSILATALIPLIFKTVAYIEFTAYFSFLWVMLTAYAIFKKQLFEIKVILTEILVGATVVISAILPFLVKTFQLKILTIGIFLLFCIIGYCLIRANYKEIKRREEIEKLSKELEGLNKTLEKKVKERTKELRKEKKLANVHREVAEERARRLEHFYSLTVGRELKMVELKQKIRELEEKLEKEKEK